MSTNDKTKATRIDIERMKPHFLSESSQIKMPTVFRFHQNKHRYYFTFKDQDFKGIEQLVNLYRDGLLDQATMLDCVKFYPSVTTVIKNSTPTSYGLIRLHEEKGKDFDKWFAGKGHYGTLMHEILGTFIIERSLNISQIQDFIDEYCQYHKVNVEFADWYWDIKKDVLAICKFFKDYDVTPIATEIVGIYQDPINDEIRFAGAIDLICELTIEEKGYWGEVYLSGANKGLPKETKLSRRALAIVDFKSGKNGFYEDHEIQLHMYRMIAEQSLEIYPTVLMNVAPSDWETGLSYKVKMQQDSKAASKIPYLLGAYFNDYKAPKNFITYDETLKWEDDPSSAVHFVPAKEYVFEKIVNKLYN